MIRKWKDEAPFLPTFKFSPSISISYPNGFTLVYKRSANYVWCPESHCLVVKKNEMDPKLSIVVTRSRKNADQNRTKFCEEYQPSLLPTISDKTLLRYIDVKNKIPNDCENFKLSHL